jgi:hypothetical protein
MDVHQDDIGFELVHSLQSLFARGDDADDFVTQL